MSREDTEEQRQHCKYCCQTVYQAHNHVKLRLSQKIALKTHCTVLYACMKAITCFQSLFIASLTI